MAGATTLSYNGVSLDWIETAEVDSEAVADPLGNIDHLYDRHTIRVEAIVAPGSVPSLPGETAAQTMARVEHLLSVPRRPFVYAVDGIPLFASNGLDPAGGPRPAGPPKITQVAAGAFHVTYTIVVCTNDCPEGATRRIWNSIRWTQEQVIDEANYSTIVTSGRLSANADMLRGLTSVDQLRGLVTPPVPPNFVRHSRYAIAADGLALEFVYTDQEQYIVPPQDAVSLDGKVTYSWTKNGGMYFVRVDLQVEGKKNAPKPRLMATALSIAFNRLKQAKPIQDKAKKVPILAEGSLWESLKKNAVGVSLVARCDPPGAVSKAGETGPAFAFGKGVGDSLVAIGLSTIPVVGPFLAAGYLATQAAEMIQQGRDQAKRQAEALKNQNLGLLPGELNQWGYPLLGCNMPGDPPAAGIGADLWGNLPAFRLIAAAFRDPCLDNTVALAENAKRQYKQAGQQDTRSSPPTGGQGPNRPTYSTTGQVLVLNGLPPVTPVQLTSVVDPYPGIFEEYMVECEYRRTENTTVLPRTVSGLSGVQVSWANPEMSLRTSWTVTKVGGPPTVPIPDPKDANTVLTDSVFLPANVELCPDGATFRYTASGCFDYKFLDKSKVNASIPVPPWLNVLSNQLPPFPSSPDVIFGDPMTNTLRSQQK